MKSTVPKTGLVFKVLLLLSGVMLFSLPIGSASSVDLGERSLKAVLESAKMNAIHKGEYSSMLKRSTPTDFDYPVSLIDFRKLLIPPAINTCRGK